MIRRYQGQLPDVLGALAAWVPTRTNTRHPPQLSNERSFRPLFWIALALLGARLLTIQAWGRFSSMYVFGDSLSAVSGGGTQYPPPPGASAANYWNGRFSNGQVWVEYLAALQGISFNTNNDFCNFGEDSSTVYHELVYGNFYPPADLGTSLCIQWSACSDCFGMALFLGTNSWSDDITLEMTNVAAAVGLLYDEGMRTLLLPNSVDVSLTPFFTYTLPSIAAVPTNEIPSLLAAIHTSVIQYNAVMALTIGQLRSQHPGLTIYAPDFFTQFNFLISHADIYGLTRTNIDALEDQSLVDKSFNGAGADYVFWDYLHPTTKMHSYVANFAQQAIMPLTIAHFAVQGSSNRLDLANLPIGRTGSLESKTNLTSQSAWTTRASVFVTNTTQTVFISTNGLGSSCFFRLNFPP